MTSAVLSLPEGWSARPPHYEDDGAVAAADLDAFLAVAGAIELTFVGELETSRDEMAASLIGVDVLRDRSLLVFDDSGRAVGAAWVEVDHEAREAWVESYGIPGVEASLREGFLGYCVDAVRQADGVESGWTVRAGTFADEHDQIESLQRKGFSHVRRFWRMYIATDSQQMPEVPPALPSGVTVAAAQTPEAQRQVWRTAEESFAEHWGHTSRSYDDFWTHVGEAVGAKPDNWWLLSVDGEPAGVCLLNDARAEFDEGYVATLGVLSAYRGRGLAKLLLQLTFHHYRAEGRGGFSLHVDSQNGTGATGLYESVGMRAVRVLDAYSLTL